MTGAFSFMRLASIGGAVEKKDTLWEQRGDVGEFPGSILGL